MGDLDSDPDDSILLAQHPEGGVAESVHVVADLPDLAGKIHKGQLRGRTVVDVNS